MKPSLAPWVAAQTADQLNWRHSGLEWNCCQPRPITAAKTNKDKMMLRLDMKREGNGPERRPEKNAVPSIRPEPALAILGPGLRSGRLDRSRVEPERGTGGLAISFTLM